MGGTRPPRPPPIYARGIYIDKHLTWSQHIDYLCTSISKSVFAINRVKYILPYAALRSLYFSLVHSRLQYGIEAWGNSNSFHKLLRIQKRAIRVINNKEYRHHTDPLFKRIYSILAGLPGFARDSCIFSRQI